RYICDQSSQRWNYGTSNDGHNNQTGRRLRICADTLNTKRKNSGEHDRHKKSYCFQSKKGQQPTSETNQEWQSNSNQAIDSQKLVWGKVAHKKCTCKSS